MINNIWAIASRELRVYFTSPIAYIVLAMFAVVFGFFFYAALGAFAYYSAQAAAQPGGPPLNVNQFVVQGTLGNFTVILLFLMPMLSMRMFAEEQRSGTLELLLTSPLTDYEIIIGKWLGALMLYLCMLAVAVINFSVVFIYATPDWQAMIVGLLGMFLIGAALLALGGFISTLTKNQIVAGALTFGLFLLLWVLPWVNQFSASTIGEICEYLSMPPHFDQFSKGVIELKDAVYFISAIALGLFLSKRSLESLRWKA